MKYEEKTGFTMRSCWVPMQVQVPTMPADAMQEDMPLAMLESRESRQYHRKS